MVPYPPRALQDMHERKGMSAPWSFDDLRHATQGGNNGVMARGGFLLAYLCIDESGFRVCHQIVMIDDQKSRQKERELKAGQGQNKPCCDEELSCFPLPGCGSR